MHMPGTDANIGKTASSAPRHIATGHVTTVPVMGTALQQAPQAQLSVDRLQPIHRAAEVPLQIDLRRQTSAATDLASAPSVSTAMVGVSSQREPPTSQVPRSLQYAPFKAHAAPAAPTVPKSQEGVFQARISSNHAVAKPDAEPTGVRTCTSQISNLQLPEVMHHAQAHGQVPAGAGFQPPLQYSYRQALTAVDGTGGAETAAARTDVTASAEQTMTRPKQSCQAAGYLADVSNDAASARTGLYPARLPKSVHGRRLASSLDSRLLGSCDDIRGPSKENDAQASTMARAVPGKGQTPAVAPAATKPMSSSKVHHCSHICTDMTADLWWELLESLAVLCALALF